jgi:hypothetical protein
MLPEAREALTSLLDHYATTLTAMLQSIAQVQAWIASIEDTQR